MHTGARGPPPIGRARPTSIDGDASETASSSSSPCSSTCTASPAPRWCRSRPSRAAGRRGRVRRVRGRAHGPDPVVAGHPGHARPRARTCRRPGGRGSASSSATPTSWASRGPSPPGSSCAGSSSAWPTAGYALKVGAEAEYFLVRRNARRRHRGRRPAGPGRGALLRRPGPDPDVRPPHDGVAPHEHARVGQLRQRPRGRQRAVRAELPLRRPADHGRPGHRVPLHGAHAWPPRRACSPPSCPSRSPT